MFDDGYLDGFRKDDLQPRSLPKVKPEDEIVISGVSGRFPDSNNMKELHENLMSKRDLITDDDRRWKINHPEIPQRTGKINNVNKFDALFFGVYNKLAHAMDPLCRLLLEHAYEAVIDAGINPKKLRGTRTGVFIGVCFSESEKTWLYERNQVHGSGIMGCSRAMLANRISYFLGLTGPSYSIDTACSSSLYALENAYRSIREGLCDAAIVGGANLCLHPYVSLQFYRLGVLSTDGICKTFDESANGYARSEAISVIFLQRAKNAKRIYATMIHGKTNCDGFKEEGITYPSTYMQSLLLKEFYMECKLPPTIVDFIEAHGTGTKVGDPEELNAIEKVFCPGRKTPLKIGSCKSNLGHSEPASGICSVAKCIIAMESGIIPPNLHYKTPRNGIPALSDGRLEVVTEPTPLTGEYIGINSFGFGGANAHVLLKANSKTKINNSTPEDDLPRLVNISGRTEDAVSTIIDDLNSKPVDTEYVALFHNIHSEDINGHIYRGYTILPPHGIAETPLKEIQSSSGEKRPVWFVFAGMGSQWPGMGEALLRLPVFAAAIKKCDDVLKPRGIDIYNVITDKNEATLDYILHAFVGISAVQIGLVDVLRSIGIEPDYMIGHSLGELGCAYADGCFNVEQTILSAYSRGLSSVKSKIIRGSMAAVGMGYKKLKDLCPEDIEVACHNASESSTISGPAESMKEFVAYLQSKNIFAREVACSNYPYHSRYIAPTGPKLLAYMKEIIPIPKLRSEKWLSTSVPIEKWNTPEAQYSSAEYHTNNVLHPVLFEETSAFIPKNAITIEIAPHGLLQAILRRSLHSSVTNLSLAQRGHRDNVEHLLQTLGKMYLAGLHPQLAKLYPPVEFPVSRSTPMISPLIKWEHSDDFFVTSYKSQDKTSGERTVQISLTDQEFESMAGHVIDGRTLFPATGYLLLVWQTLALMTGKLFPEVSVTFEDVKFMRATPVPKEATIEFTISVHRGTGRFEVFEGGAAVVIGNVKACTNPKADKVNPPIAVDEEEVMNSSDIYKELRLRGYNYSGIYKSIISASTTGSKGQIAWRNNWAAFMDNMLQMSILKLDTRGLFVPTSIKKLVIDTTAQLSQLKIGQMEKVFPVYFNKLLDVITCGGVEIHGIKASAIARRKPLGDPVLEEYKFVAHMDEAETNLPDIAKLTTHIALENHLDTKVKTLELIDESDDVPFENYLSPILAETLGDIPLIHADVSIISKKTKLNDGSIPPNVSVIDLKKVNNETNAVIAVGHKLLTKDRENNLNALLLGLKPGGFLLTREINVNSNITEKFALEKGLHIILVKKYKSEILIFFKKAEQVPKTISVVFVDNNKFNWVDEMRSVMNNVIEKENIGKSIVILVGQGDFENGLTGLVNCIRKEPGGEIVRGYLIQDSEAPKFSLDNPLYAKQIQKDLAMNVLRENNCWGTYRHLSLPTPKPIPVRHAFVNETIRSDLSSLTWLEGPIQIGQQNKDFINIVYSSINFKDVMLASGKLPIESCSDTRQGLECVIGFEYSGIDNSGKRLMGMIANRALANLCIADRDLSWEVPKNWSLEDAATIPVVYGTSYYALYECGKMKKGDKVLIHAGTGGVGQAAINLALHEGCEVFTTVGTEEKRNFIRKHFPQIPDDHIGNSRDISFEKMIATQTNGRGVDIVLNSLAEEKLRASVNCLAWGGRFLEIGKFDLTSDNQLGMSCFLREISFHGVMLDRFFKESSFEKLKLQKMMAEGLKKGSIKPLIRTIFPKEQIEEAFRFMAAGKHIGKVIIKVRDENEPMDKLTLAMPRYYCMENGSYLILGGLGGFGLELADWLVLRGAKNLILTSRHGLKNGYQKLRIDLWKSYGVKVVIIAGKDASKLEDCRFILDTANKVAPVDAIFNLAVELNDAIWSNQTPKTFEQSFRSKARATKNFDILTREMCPKLRNFVVFSSVACGKGNAGQTNYGMSNSVMERICERRAAEGLPALAVQWGAVGDVGLVADIMPDNREPVIGGTLLQKINSCLHELDGFLKQNRPIVCSMVVAEKRATSIGSINVVDTVLNIMGLKDLNRVSQSTSLAELGMDSMMSVEIKQTLEREFEIFLTAQDIRSLTFAKLKELANKDEASTSVRYKCKIETEQKETYDVLQSLLRLVGKKDLVNEVYLKLPTRNESGTEEIFMIPGVEGMGSVFMDIAKNIKSPATCLQLRLDSKNQSTIDEMVDEFLPYITERTKKHRNFTIVGYSFGSVIGIELARRLENAGFNGKLILIDGSPDYIQGLINSMKTDKNCELEDTVLLGVVYNVSPSSVPKFITELEKYKTWDEKLEAAVKYLTFIDENSLSIEDQKAFALACYKRLLAFENYYKSSLPRINTPIILLKPTLPSIQEPSEDYGLSKVTSSKVKINNVEGHHSTILKNEKVATIINNV